MNWPGPRLADMLQFITDTSPLQCTGVWSFALLSNQLSLHQTNQFLPREKSKSCCFISDADRLDDSGGA